MKVKPFIKWVGGKNSLLNIYESFYPMELKEGLITTYIEPFIGGGASLFYIMQKYDIEHAVISDINNDLINTYLVIKYSIQYLLEYLSRLEELYNSSNSEKRKQLFYQIRDKFNTNKISNLAFFPRDKKYIEKAGDFIFLNKTCFNGYIELIKTENLTYP
jgi:DNA adenine methylase